MAFVCACCVSVACKQTSGLRKPAAPLPGAAFILTYFLEYGRNYSNHWLGRIHAEYTHPDFLIRGSFCCRVNGATQGFVAAGEASARLWKASKSTHLR